MDPTDFWDMTTCTLPGGYHRFKATYYLIRKWLVMKWPISTIPGKDKRERHTWINRKVSPGNVVRALMDVRKSSKPNSAGL